MKTSSPRCTSFIRRGTVVSLIGLAGTLAVPAAVPAKFRPAAARSLMNGFAVEMVATDALRSNERAFLGKAVESCGQQMRLAEVGASQADSSEVRSHALQLSTDYRQLSEGLEALIRRKGGIPGAPVGGTSENYQKLAEKAGSAFDREFVRVVADRSNDVMSLFEQAAANAKDPDVREFAAAELPVLRAHRNAIADLKKSLE